MLTMTISRSGHGRVGTLLVSALWIRLFPTPAQHDRLR